MKGVGLFSIAIFLLCLGVVSPLEAAGDSHYTLQRVVIIVVEGEEIAKEQRGTPRISRQKDYRERSPWYYEEIDEYGYRDRRCRLLNKYTVRCDYRYGYSPWCYEYLNRYHYRSGVCGQRW